MGWKEQPANEFSGPAGDGNGRLLRHGKGNHNVDSEADCGLKMSSTWRLAGLICRRQANQQFIGNQNPPGGIGAYRYNAPNAR